jgi:hypothetical protein
MNSMHPSSAGLTIGRRALFVLGCGLLASLCAAEFWDAKPPAQWSDDEIARLLSDSPWARPAAIEFVNAAGGASEMAGPAAPLGGAEEPAPGPGRTRGNNASASAIGFPRGGERVGAPVPPERRIGPETLKATVLWESARPALDALRAPLPEGMGDRCVISVSGALLARVKLDAGGASTQEALDALKRDATLTVGSRAAIHPEIVQRDNTGRTFRFGFSRDALSAAKGDIEVLFLTQIAGLRIQARFSPAAMIYQGKLAL